MVKDKILKPAGIVLSGTLVPVWSHLIQLGSLQLVQVISSFVFFLISVHITWQVNVSVVRSIKESRLNEKIYWKVVVIMILSFLISALIMGCAAFIWQWAFIRQWQAGILLRASLISGGGAVLFSLIGEVLYLNYQRELGNQVVKHLDRELLEAEVNVLKNELDPHFVYNTLMPLYYLIKNDGGRAELFANKLIQVYQYFLENRQNDFILLSEELSFIRNYFYLLEIRFNKAISLHVQSSIEPADFMVLPFSLQVLVENAIKHNDMQMETPLEIKITIGAGHVTVSNRMRPVTEKTSSSRIGLNNLRSRYKILCNSDISVISTREIFAVKLPLKRKIEADDLDNYHRGRSYQF